MCNIAVKVARMDAFRAYGAMKPVLRRFPALEPVLKAGRCAGLHDDGRIVIVNSVPKPMLATESVTSWQCYGSRNWPSTLLRDFSSLARM